MKEQPKFDNLNKQLTRKILKSIIQNIDQKDNRFRELIGSKAEQYQKTGDYMIVDQMMNKNKDFNDILMKQVKEYFAWQGAYRQTIKQGNFPEFKSSQINIDENFLLPILAKASLIDPHRAYLMEAATFSRKKGSAQFGKRWSQIKKQKFEQTTSKLQGQFPELFNQKSRDKEEPGKPKQNKQIYVEDVEEEEFKVPSQAVQPVVSQQSSRPTPTYTEQMQRQQRIKNKAQKQAEIIYSNKLQRMVKYLESRGDFVYQNTTEEVAKEILAILDRFISQKTKYILHAAKLRHEGYNSVSIGSQFKVYSQHNHEQQIVPPKQACIRIPNYDQSLKFYKLQMPSKLQQYNRLRIQEEKHQQYYRNQMKSKTVDMDKKTQKFLQNYTLEDPRASNKTEQKVDLGEHKTTRLKITTNCIQWMLMKDPYFCDGWVMHRSMHQG